MEQHDTRPPARLIPPAWCKACLQGKRKRRGTILLRHQLLCVWCAIQVIKRLLQIREKNSETISTAHIL